VKKYISLILILLLFCGSAFSQTKSDLFATTKIWVVTWSGAKGNGTADDTTAFTNAIVKAASNTLFVPKGTYKITNNVTAGATVEVWFANGVTLDIANTKTFTVSGKLHTPFLPTITGAGTFTYSAATIPIATVGGASPTLPSATQGDILYASTTDTWSNLVKSTSSTRYLSNTGTSNNPAWAQVALATGVSGTLPVANGGTGVTSIPSWITTAYIPINLMESVLWADGSNNTVTITSEHDNTNFCNYIRATSSTASQDYDLVIEFQIPTDFGSFPATCLSINTRTSDKTNCACTISMYIAAGSVDAGINGAVITPTVANDVWYSFTDQPTGAYAAGDWCHIHIHISTGDGTPDTFDVARLALKYTKA
jgi:hypothetical protein